MCAAKLVGLLAARLRLSPPEAAGPADILVQLIRAPTSRIELGLIRYGTRPKNIRKVRGPVQCTIYVLRNEDTCQQENKELILKKLKRLVVGRRISWDSFTCSVNKSHFPVPSRDVTNHQAGNN